jgi:hypothetical protein
VRRLAALAAALAVALSGCGGTSKKAATPLGDALAYLPKDAPAVVAIETDPAQGQWKQVDDLIQKFSVAPQIRQQGKDRIARGPLDFDRDLRPQFGNELVVGVPKAGPGYVVALKLKDPAAAKNGLQAKLKADGLESRIDGDVLVAAPTSSGVSGAVEQHGLDNALTEQQFETDLGRLKGGDPLVRATGNFQTALGSAQSARAREALPWIGSLRRFAATGTARPDGLAVEFDVRTDSVPARDLPLAPGPRSPPVPRRDGEIAVAVRDPGRTLGFVQRLGQLMPKTPGSRSTLERLLRAGGVDVQRDLIAKLGDSGAVSLPLNGTYVARADLKDPKGFAASLAKLYSALALAPGILGFSIEPGGGAGFYRISGTNGRQLFVGVTGNRVALGDEAGRARDFATAKASPVPGARGSVALAADGRSVANKIIERRFSGALGLFGQLVTQPIGDLTGWAETTPTGIAGHADLKIK